MKIRKSMVVASALAAVPVVLGVTAAPASALQKSCLSMHIAYEQATLSSTHADAMMTSFQDNVTDYADSNGFYRRTGWYWDMAGHMQHYDVDSNFWYAWNSDIIDTAEFYASQAAEAYDTYLADCGY